MFYNWIFLHIEHLINLFQTLSVYNWIHPVPIKFVQLKMKYGISNTAYQIQFRFDSKKSNFNIWRSRFSFTRSKILAQLKGPSPGIVILSQQTGQASKKLFWYNVKLQIVLDQLQDLEIESCTIFNTRFNKNYLLNSSLIRTVLPSD